MFAFKFYKLLVHYQLSSKRKDISILNKELISLANLTSNDQINQTNCKINDKKLSRVFPFRSKSIDDNLLVDKLEREDDHIQSIGKQHLLVRATLR